MEPICYKVPRQKPETVRAEYWDLPYFYEPVHFHDECQLTYIIEGEGILFLGDKLDRFKKGDLYLIGPRLPHVFRNDPSYFKEDSNLRAKAITIFFLKDALMAMFDKIPEAYNIERLLENSNLGVRLTNENAHRVLPNMKNLLKLNGIQKVFELLIAISRISIDKNVEIISTGAPLILEEEDSIKLNKVFDFISKKFNERISLKEVSSLVCMTPTSFCRYFKRRTQKTFSQYLIEVRISNACKYLVESQYNVAETCYSSGYNNISNFHRHFISITGMTPNKYRRNAVNV